jgi:hypothetical protein
MAQRPGQQESFVVRIWRERGQAGWRGWIQHTRSGESAVVCNVEDLLAFIERRTGKLDQLEHHGLK